VCERMIGDKWFYSSGMPLGRRHRYVCALKEQIQEDKAKSHAVCCMYVYARGLQGVHRTLVPFWGDENVGVLSPQPSQGETAGSEGVRRPLAEA